MGRGKFAHLHRGHTDAVVTDPPRAPGLRPFRSESDLADLRAIVLQETSVDLDHFRSELVWSVIARRMARRQFQNTADYTRYVRESADEQQEVLLELHPSTGTFFQDVLVFESLRTGLYGNLWKERRPGDKFRAWVPCCCRGEETYSVAIALIEMLERLEPRGAMQVFGTDLNDRSLDVARAGIYQAQAMEGLSEERRARFFKREGESYRIRREVRELCLFARHNLPIDAPLSRMDLIVFRNYLTLLNSSMQGRVLERLHYGLKPGGVLILGPSEDTEVSSTLFTPASSKRGIYFRRPTEGRVWFKPAASTETQIRAAGSDKTAFPPEGPRTEKTLVRPTLPARSNPKALEEQSKETGVQIQSLLEEQAKTIESLRLANEEIISSNEELQVTNEELTAAREELQAANQELATLNEEMQHRNDALDRTMTELLALFRNLDAAVVTVDCDLRIRRFTPKASRLFSIAAGDTGRRLTDLQPKLHLPELEGLVQDSIHNLAAHEREVRDAGGLWYRVIIRPYRDEDGAITGAIITAWIAGGGVTHHRMLECD